MVSYTGGFLHTPLGRVMCSTWRPDRIISIVCRWLRGLNQAVFEDLAQDLSHWGVALEKVPRLQALKGSGLGRMGLNRAVPQVRRLSVR